MKDRFSKTILRIITILVFTAAVSAQSGGDFAIKQGTVSSGGGDSGGGAFGAKGTAGQPVAGTRSNGGQFGVAGGFWAIPAAPPTAAGVSVSGRVTTPNGNGLRNAFVVLTDAQGVVRRMITSSFGYYRFDDVSAGETYVISVSSKRFQFTPRVLNVTDELTEVDFVGLE